MSLLSSLVHDLIRSHPSDAADVLSGMSAEDAVRLLAMAEPEDGAAVLGLMARRPAGDCLVVMAPEVAGSLLSTLPAHVAAGLLRAIPQGSIAEVLRHFSDGKRRGTEELLRYPVHSIGETMDTAQPAVPVHWTLDQVRESQARVKKVYCPYVYVIDGSGRLVGVMHSLDLEGNQGGRVEDVMKRSVVRVHAFSPLESVLDHPGWREYDILPVTGTREVLVGTLRHKQLLRSRSEMAEISGAAEPLTETVLTLGELCWGGLWNVVDGFASPPHRDSASRSEQ